MEYRRLIDAMQTKGLSNRAVAATIGMPEATFRVKINGQTEGGFTMDEAIYSQNYGIELDDLFGEPLSFVCAELEDRITEALIQDDRIESISDFEFFSERKGEVLTTFTVHTIFGDIESERKVNF